MNIQQLRHSLKLKWVSYYYNNRSWLGKMRVWGTYDGQRRPSSGFILATLSVLEPQLEEIFPFILELNNDPDQIVAALGLNFNPQEQLHLVELADSATENDLKSEFALQTLLEHQPLTPSVVDKEENSQNLDNLSPNLSPCRTEAFNSPHSLLGKQAGGLGFALVFPHGVKSQVPSVAVTTEVPPQMQTESQPSTFSAIANEVESQSQSLQSVAVASTGLESKNNPIPLMTVATTQVESKSQSKPSFFRSKVESKSKSKSVSLAAFIASELESKPVSDFTLATQVEGKGRLVTTPQQDVHNQVNPPPASTTSHLANWIDGFCQGVGGDKEETRLMK